jgi:hypothetical protein
VWGATVEEVGSEAGPVTWGGQVLVGADEEDAAARLQRFGERPGLVHGTVKDVAAHLRALGNAGATWAVCAPLDIATDPVAAVENLAEVRRALALA